MSQAPTLTSLVDDVASQLPALALALYHEIDDALKAKPELHVLQGPWGRRRAYFSGELELALRPLLQAAREGRDPLQRDRPAELDSLSLVDERQALQDVSIAHVVSQIEEMSRAELHQLGNFFAALRGIARPLKNDNPLRAALFAHALNRVIQGIELDAEGRYALMRAAATPLARNLHPIYGQLCQQLRDARLSSMVASHGSGVKESDLRMRQFRSQAAPSQSATLDDAAQRVDAVNSRPQRLAHPAAPPRLGPGSAAAQPGTDLLSRLYDQILADASLLPPLKVLLGRLQVAIVRLSREDRSLLRRQDHPTWLLLNRIAAHGAGFARADDAELQAFVRFVEAQIQPLLEAAQPSAALFQQALVAVDQQIRTEAEKRGERSATALVQLEREQHRAEWRKLLHEQLQAQLDEAQPGQALRQFLLGPWVDVIAQAMVQQGRDAPLVQAYVGLVDELLASVQPHADEAARQRLRAQLPPLVQRLEQGMDSIALPPAPRQALLGELMRQHGRVLRGLPALEEAVPAPVAAKAALTPEELLQQLLAERESHQPSRWAHEQVNRGELPTVPVQLYSEPHTPSARAAMDAWISGLQLGAWYHLFVQSQWLTAQIAWISDSRQLVLFVAQDAEERHSLTRGALEQLLSNGLITLLEEETLVQRALGSLMQDLDDKL